MSATRSRRRNRFRPPDVIQKPAGTIHPRVQKVGPDHFGIVSVRLRQRTLHLDARRLVEPDFAYHLLNSGNAGRASQHKPADFDVFERIMAEVCVDQTAKRLGLQQTLRPQGRPVKPRTKLLNAPCLIDALRDEKTWKTVPDS
jgi:hypothetical protein